MITVDKTIRANEFKLFFFICLTVAIILFFGYLITEIFNFGMMGIYSTIIVAILVNLFSYFFSKTLVLKSQKAIPMTANDYPEYYNMVKNMCDKNNIKLPELYYINSPSLNAFATGRNQNDAAVVVTSGLLKKVPLDEISGVIGHELSHIVHKDIMISSFIAIMVGMFTIMASFVRSSSVYRTSNRRSNNNDGLLIFACIAAMLAPLVGLIIKMAVSRSREYMADATGGQICGDPGLLAKALYRISHDGCEMPMANEATAQMYIANPLKTSMFAKLFSTHPDINDRINRLQEMDANSL